jgi:hypothetical protein
MNKKATAKDGRVSFFFFFLNVNVNGWRSRGKKG